MSVVDSNQGSSTRWGPENQGGKGKKIRIFQMSPDTQRGCRFCFHFCLSQTSPPFPFLSFPCPALRSL